MDDQEIRIDMPVNAEQVCYSGAPTGPDLLHQLNEMDGGILTCILSIEDRYPGCVKDHEVVLVSGWGNDEQPAYLVFDMVQVAPAHIFAIWYGPQSEATLRRDISEIWLGASEQLSIAGHADSCPSGHGALLPGRRKAFLKVDDPGWLKEARSGLSQQATDSIEKLGSTGSLQDF